MVTPRSRSMVRQALSRAPGPVIAALALLLIPAVVGAAEPPAPPAGPPYPDPVDGRVVYDFADVLAPATETEASAVIAGIEERTGAEVVVYTQVKPETDTVAEAEADAIALIDQWGVGRQGFDDGLAILFDMDESLCHGQVQLYAGPGYRAAFLTNEERQHIFDEEMLPHLRRCELDAALGVALARIDANATPEHAGQLQLGRQVNGLLGLVVAPLTLLLLVGWAGRSWWRYGKDPVYLDDPSILMAGPPPELTPAAGAMLYDGRSSRRTLTTAMLDLASRGEIAFRRDDAKPPRRRARWRLGIGRRPSRDRTGIQLLDPSETDPQLARNRRRPLSEAEAYALKRLRSIGKGKKDGYIDPDELLRFGGSVESFDRYLEKHVAKRGWFREPPRKAVARWDRRGFIAAIVGVVIVAVAFFLPSGGLLLVGGALVIGGIAVMVLARTMPARTMAGAVLFAMLAAYRRTLHKTMEQARSMDQVVERAGLPWLETPDQAAVWGVALGLQKDVQNVLQRSLEDLQGTQGAASTTWTPSWYSEGPPSDHRGGSDGVAPGMLGSSVVPDFNGMMSAIGTIGNSPSSSGGSGSGGFSGGSGGGGGGGSGGGF